MTRLIELVIVVRWPLSSCMTIWSFLDCPYMAYAKVSNVIVYQSKYLQAGTQRDQDRCDSPSCCCWFYMIRLRTQRKGVTKPTEEVAVLSDAVLLLSDEEQRLSSLAEAVVVVPAASASLKMVSKI